MNGNKEVLQVAAAVNARILLMHYTDADKWRNIRDTYYKDCNVLSRDRFLKTFTDTELISIVLRIHATILIPYFRQHVLYCFGCQLIDLTLESQVVFSIPLNYVDVSFLQLYAVLTTSVTLIPLGMSLDHWLTDAVCLFIAFYLKAKFHYAILVADRSEAGRSELEFGLSLAAS